MPADTLQCPLWLLQVWWVWWRGQAPGFILWPRAEEGESQVLSQKGHLPSLLPIVAQLGRGGWKPLDYTMVGTAIIGRRTELGDPNSLPLPHTPWQSRVKAKIVEKELALGARQTGSPPPATFRHQSGGAP